MPHAKINKRTLTERQWQAPFQGKKEGQLQALLWDTELKGFGVLISCKTSARSFIAQRDLPNGRTRRVTIGSVVEYEAAGKSVDDARNEAAKILLGMRSGIDPKMGRRAAATLQDTLDDYLKARKTLKERSKTGYRRMIENHLKDWLGYPLRDITPEMVERKHVSIQKQVQRREEERTKAAKRAGPIGQQVPRGENSITVTGNATANGVMVGLRALWNFAADRDPTLPQINPVRRLKKGWFPVKARERRISTDQLPAFHRGVMGLSNEVARDFLLLLLFTGMRRTEASSLAWTNIDLSQRVIRLTSAQTKAQRKLDLPMSDYVHGLLVARRAKGNDGSFVFPANSKSEHIEEPKSFFREIGEKSGIYVSSHDIRRTFIDVAESTEMSVYALKALVNHSAGRDVTAGYLGMGPERLREAAQKVADKMKALCGVAEPEAANVQKLVRSPTEPIGLSA